MPTRWTGMSLNDSSACQRHSNRVEGEIRPFEMSRRSSVVDPGSESYSKGRT